MSLQGKVALITGGGMVVGIDSVRRLAKEGAALALHYNGSSSREQTLRFRDEVRQSYPGVKVSIHGGDLGTAAAVEKLFNDALVEHKKIDIVVNSAGAVLQKPVSQVSEAEYDKMFAYSIFVDEQRRKWVGRYNESMQRLQ